MSRLPSVLGTGDLHLAELCAARIDGELVGFVDGCPAVVDREELAVESCGAEFGEREVIGAEHRGKPGHEVMVRHRAAPRTP